MELREEIARGLCGREVMPGQQRQRLVLAKLVEVFPPLATGRPQRQQAFHRLRGAQAPPAALQLNLPVDHRCRPGLAEHLDQPGTPACPVINPVSSSLSISKSSRAAILSPRTRRVKLTTRREQR